MYIKVNDNEMIDFDLDIFEENEYEKHNIHFEMLCKTLEIKDFYPNKIQICNFKSEEEVVRFINYFILDTTESVKCLQDKTITVTYKPYMLQNDFEIITYIGTFETIKEMMI